MATQPYPDLRKKDKNTGGTICEQGEKDKCQLDQVDSKFYQFYLDSLKNEILDARSTVNATITERDTASNTQLSILCCREKAEQSFEEYQRIDLFLSTVFDQGSDDLKVKISDLATKDQSLVKIFDEAGNALRDLKKKTGELKDAACKLKYAMPDPCNSEQLKALRTQIKAEGGKKDFDTIVNSLIGDAESICMKVTQSFEISVKVAGIHAYLNVGGLKPLADEFVASVDTFKADIDANIAYATGEWNRTYTEYLAQLRIFNNKECNFRLWQWKQYSLCKTKDFVCEPVCDNTGIEDRLTRICEQVEGKFSAKCPDGEKPNQETKPQRPTGNYRPIAPRGDI